MNSQRNNGHCYVDSCPNGNYGGFPIGNIVDCCVGPSEIEYLHIPNAVADKWYLLLIQYDTSWGNYNTGIITIERINSCSVGNTNCEMVLCPPQGDTVCEGETAYLIVDSMPGCTYRWEGPNDFLSNSSNHILTFPNASPTISGTYVFTLIYPSGSTAVPKSTQLLVNPKPIMNPTNDTICNGQTATLNATGANSYIWKENQNIIGTSDTIFVSPTQTTQYKVIGTTTWGCKDSATTQVVVNQKPIVSVSPSTICSGQSSTATASLPSTFQWSNGFTTPTITPEVATDVNFKVVATTQFGCQDSAFLLVNKNPTIVATDKLLCKGDTTEISATGGENYLWANGSTQSSIIVSPVETTKYIVTGYNSNNCSSQDTATVSVYPNPISDFLAQPTIVFLEDATISFFNRTTGAISYLWNFGEDGSTSTEKNPFYTYNSLGYHSVTLFSTNTYGCIDSISKKIQVKSPFYFYVPNAFTPNKDDINEGFCPKGVGVSELNYSMQIYNRWGNLVFSTTKPYACWDGTTNGSPATENSYIYKITLNDTDGKEHQYIGKVVIMR